MMSGPKYSEFELEQIRKEKIRVTENIISCILSAKDICEKFKLELSKIEQQKEVVRSSNLSEQEKNQILSEIVQRKQRLDKLIQLSISICNTDYSGELEELKTVYASVSEKIEKLFDMESNEYDPSNLFNVAMRTLTDSFDSRFFTPEYTLEEALAELHKQKSNASSGKSCDNLSVFRNSLLSEAQSLLRDTRITDDDKSKIEQAIVVITTTDKQDVLHNIKSKVLNEIVYKRNKYKTLYSEYRKLISTKIALQRRLMEDTDKVEEDFPSISMLQTKICKLKHEISTLEKQVTEKAEREEIAHSIDETMKELGYHIIGKKNGDDESTMALYVFDQKNGIRVTRDKNGMIVMRVVGIKKTGNDESEWTQAEIFSVQNAFCGAYSRILRKLEEKGIVMRNGSDKRMPPSQRYWKTVREEEYTSQSALTIQSNTEDKENENNNKRKNNTHKRQWVKRLD